MENNELILTTNTYDLNRIKEMVSIALEIPTDDFYIKNGNWTYNNYEKISIYIDKEKYGHFGLLTLQITKGDDLVYIVTEDITFTIFFNESYYLGYDRLQTLIKLIICDSLIDDRDIGFWETNKTI